ncbi:MAG: SDR family oxidoreductase [Gemmatimonadaceae bacterium]
MQIKNSVALVTGANRGIGRAFVEALLGGGASRVYATARTASTLDSVVALDEKRVHAVTLDVKNVADAKNAAAMAQHVTLLINNAGVLNFGGLTDIPLATVRDDMDINFFGTLNMVNAFAPTLERNHGVVVNMLSLLSLASMPGLASYNASKAAMWSLTQSYRADLGKRGVKVFSVFPGSVDTDMIRSFEMPKTPAIDVARAVLAGIEAGEEDIFPDEMARQVYAGWKQDHKAIERQFGSM